MDLIEQAVRDKESTYQKFLAEHEADVKEFAFEVTRHGDYFAFFTTRGGVKKIFALRTKDASRIQMIEGANVSCDKGCAHFAASVPPFVTYQGVSYPRNVVDENDDDDDEIGDHYLIKMPTRSIDDQIYFGRGKFKLYIPFGFGKKCFDAIMDACRRQ